MQDSNRAIRKKRDQISDSKEHPDKQGGFEAQSEKKHKREVEAHPYKRGYESVDKEILSPYFIETTFGRDKVYMRWGWGCSILHKKDSGIYPLQDNR